MTRGYIAAPIGEKYCPKCEATKALDQFHKDRNGRSGHATYCKSCSAFYNKRYQEQSSSHSWMKRYGISEQGYWDLYEEQDHVCAICQKPETHTIKGTLCLLAVDHNHSSGAVRGLLCHACNVLLGHAADNIAVLENAIDYLKRGPQ